MKKSEFFQRIQMKLREELISEEAAGIGLEIKLDPHTKALAEVIYDVLIPKEQADGKADEG